jgi:ABC-2 type transport system permease protein
MAITTEVSGPPSTSQPARRASRPAAELWRGTWVIFRKHMHKFLRNGTELGGTLAAPLLLAVTFGAGMNQIVDASALGGADYLTFITPGILAFTALSGAINAGMTSLEEKIRGYLKEYLVAPIPRTSILLASALSGAVKTVAQSLLILGIAVIFGAGLTTDAAGLATATLSLLLFVAAFVGFANGMALRSKSIGGYHTLLFLLNLPLLFLSSALYPLDAMPAWMRVVAYLNPTTYVVEGLRHGLYANGGLPVWLIFAVLGAYALLLNWFGLRSFHRVVG